MRTDSALASSTIGRCYLRYEELRPLDVVLSRSPHLTSKTAACLSGGKFSHASFVIDPLMWFDAQPAGCGYHFLTDNFAQVDREYLDLRAFGSVAVLRHPIIDLLSLERRSQLEQTAQARCQRLMG